MEEETLFRAKVDTEGHLYLEDSDKVIFPMDKRFWQIIAKRWERGSEFLGGFNQKITVGEVKSKVDRIVKIIKQGTDKREEKK